MDIRELKAVLERIEHLYFAAGARAAARDLHAVIGLLVGHENESVADFIQATKTLLVNKDRPTGAIAEEFVAKHSKALLATGTDREKFDAAMSAIEIDDAVSAVQWAAIANAYRNVPTNDAHVYKFGWQRLRALLYETLSGSVSKPQANAGYRPNVALGLLEISCAA